MEIFSCDLETTTKEEDCRTWAAGIYNVETEDFEYSNSFEWLFHKLETYETCKAYFHNLKFDGSFFLDWLFRNGYEHSTEKKLLPGQFNTLISDKNQFYSIKIKTFEGASINLLDSMKIIPFSVKVIAKAFGLKTSKGEIDYKKERPIGYKIDDIEADYLHRDCKIAGQALRILFKQGLNQMTQGSNALYNFKTTLPQKFEKIFPQLECDDEIRPAYKGGVTFANPIYQGQNIGFGKVYDKNSMYPSMMKYELMPYGEPKTFEGEYTKDKLYPLYVQKINVCFDLKPDHLPTIQIKNGYSGFIPTEYVRSSNEEEIILTLTSVDLELFKEQYDIHYIEYLGGWKFKGTTGLFDKYIDYWYGVKEEASRTGNKGMRTLAKLMLNALYGKFATSKVVQSKVPYFNEEKNKVCYKLGEKEERDGVYLPVACFITSYARADVIRNAQANYDRFAYADTDSLHLIGHGEPVGLTIDKYKLGAWSLENVFYRARFLRAKCYIEEVPEEIKKPSKRYRPTLKLRKLGKQVWVRKILTVTCAGMPYACHKHVTWENFSFGKEYIGKMRFKTVPGGAILVDTPYKLKIA